MRKNTIQTKKKKNSKKTFLNKFLGRAGLTTGKDGSPLDVYTNTF